MTADTDALSERADQSTWFKPPKMNPVSSAACAVPTTSRARYASSLVEELHDCDIYLGSPTAGIAATLYERYPCTHGYSPDCFSSIPRRGSLWSTGSHVPPMPLISYGSHRPWVSTSPSARPIASSAARSHPCGARPTGLLREKVDAPCGPTAVDLTRDRRGLKIAKEDLADFSRSMEREFSELASRYYLTLTDESKDPCHPRSNTRHVRYR